VYTYRVNLSDMVAVGGWTQWVLDCFTECGKETVVFGGGNGGLLQTRGRFLGEESVAVCSNARLCACVTLGLFSRSRSAQEQHRGVGES